MTQVLLGFEVGTGARVEIPLAHTFVTGQTQLSGKTTTLRAIVERSRKRALAFVTKRGESFPGRRIKPYLPREGEEPIHWRLVETILASALGEKKLKYERVWLINASRGARSLTDVARNVERLRENTKDNRSRDAYMLIGEYLQLVLPEMRALTAADVLALGAGLNVMDLAGHSQQLQALVIRAALEQINRHERDVLTVFPEAWEFAPRAMNAPAKDAAIGMARKGAVLGNFLLCDSQDIAGVDTTVRQAASVWVLGVQRELNELKRTIQTIPAGIKRPKPEDVATLEVGQFFACWGRHAVKVYVMPAGMSELEARDVALGVKPRPRLAAPAPVEPSSAFESVAEIGRRVVSQQLDAPRGDGVRRAAGGGAGNAATPAASRRPAATDVAPITLGDVQRFVDKGRHAQAVAEHLAYHGPGLTFGELGIGQQFEWAAPIPVGPEPMVKVSATRYEIAPGRDGGGGSGTAEDYYRVERAGTRSREGNEDMNAEQEKKLDRLVGSVDKLVAAMATIANPLLERRPDGEVRVVESAAAARLRNGEAANVPAAAGAPVNVDIIVDAVIARLRDLASEDPGAIAPVVEVLVQRPEIRVKVERYTITVDGESLRGRVAQLILEGWFDKAQSPGTVQEELKSRGFNAPAPNVGKELAELARMGFFTRNNKWFTLVQSMKRAVVEA